MKINQIGHLAFICQNLETSIAFYRDALGCKHKFTITYGDMLAHVIASVKAKGVAPDPDRVRALEAVRDKDWIAYFEAGDGGFFELFDPGSATIQAIPDGRHFNYSHVALVVEDIHAAHAELLEKGVPVDSPPSLGLEGTWQMWSHDPDGNKIEFMQYTPASWQLVGR